MHKKLYPAVKPAEVTLVLNFDSSIDFSFYVSRNDELMDTKKAIDGQKSLFLCNFLSFNYSL